MYKFQLYKRYGKDKIYCGYRETEYEIYLSRRKQEDFQKNFAKWIGEKIMRIDLGMVLAIIFEYIIFIYYADTLFFTEKEISIFVMQ